MACHFSIKRLRGNDAVADPKYIRVRWNGLAQLGRGADQGNADAVGVQAIDGSGQGRSEEHTSELQSLMRISYALFCSKKKTKPENKSTTMQSTYTCTTLQTQSSRIIT